MWGSARQRVSDFAADWAVPICIALATGVAVWLVWYFTKPECTATAAANGICNPGIVARYITVEILLQSGGAALAAGALKGGYDRYMMRRMINEEQERTEQERERLEQEREARQQAELELIEARKRNEENTARLFALREEALRQAEAAREEAYRQANADREAARQQAIAEREEAVVRPMLTGKKPPVCLPKSSTKCVRNDGRRLKNAARMSPPSRPYSTP